MMRYRGRGIHSLQRTIGVTEKPQVPTGNDAVVFRCVQPLDHCPRLEFRAASLARGTRCWSGYRFENGPRSIESIGGRLEIARDHFGVSQPIAGFSEKSVGAAFLGARHQLGSDRSCSANIGTQLLYKEKGEKCPPALFPIDTGTLTKGYCALDRAFDFRRSQALRIAEGASAVVAKIQLQLGARVVVGQLLQKIKSGFEKRDCFGDRAATLALLDRKEAISDCFFGIAAVGVMMRQCCEVIAQVIAIDRFQAGADPFVQQPPAFIENRVIRYVMGKSMLERVLEVSHRRLLVDELTQLKTRTSIDPRLDASGSASLRDRVSAIVVASLFVLAIAELVGGCHT